jgi:endonuclease/exonuclease/phosphatase family metal-dependent hydrolase
MPLPLLSLRTTAALDAPRAAQRRAILDLPGGPASHEAAVMDHTGLFDRLEVRPPPQPPSPPAASARIAFWNLERGKHLAQTIPVLEDVAADALLLCELDLGMARSAQMHVARELAQGLRTGYAFGVEYLELELGDPREQVWHAGQSNRAGLHGAAILSPHPLERPALVRLESDGGWFDGRRGERRTGGRMAVLATLNVAGVPVTLACVHLESHSDPAFRAAQLQVLLDAIEHYAPGCPALIGGDLNTSTITRDWSRGRGEKPDLPPARLLDPVPYEPLFERAAAAGFGWLQHNVPRAPTQRTRPDGTPRPPLGKIDWFLGRGLAASEPRIVPAVDEAGRALSDHEILLVTVAPPD